MSELTAENLLSRINGLQEEIDGFINEYPSLHLDTASSKFLPELTTCLELIKEQVNDKECEEVKSEPLFMMYGTRGKDFFLEEVFDTARSVKDRAFAEKLTDELHEFLDRIKSLTMTFGHITRYSPIKDSRIFQRIESKKASETISLNKLLNLRPVKYGTSSMGTSV